jgi:hypothetical protein
MVDRVMPCFAVQIFFAAAVSVATRRRSFNPGGTTRAAPLLNDAAAAPSPRKAHTSSVFQPRYL